jgi:hypothetical protein
MKKGGRTVEVNFSIPAALAKRLETLEGKNPSELAAELLLQYYDDKRRTTILVKRMGISWHPELYAGLVSYVGRGQISQWCRQSIYMDLKTYQHDIIPPPAWKENMAAKKVKAARAVSDDRLTVVSPMIVPQQWFDLIDSRWPGKVSTYCKAVVQTKLEKLTGKQYALSRGMHEFMARD